MKSIQKYIYIFLLCSFVSGIGFAFTVDASFKKVPQDESRYFKEDLKSKYNGRDFTYKDPEPARDFEEIESDDKSTKKARQRTSNGFSPFLQSLSFLKYFIYLIIPLAVFFIVKAVLQMKKKVKTLPTKTERTLHAEEEENLTSLDLSDRLQNAIKNKNYRLAIRYYYLNVLKKMYDKKLIDYDPKKTNLDYFNELKNKNAKQRFSYLSYVYDYTWYGEFPVDEQKFLKAQQSFTTFLKSI